MAQKLTVALAIQPQRIPQVTTAAHLGDLAARVDLRRTEVELTPGTITEFAADADVVITSWGTPALDLAKLPRLRAVGHAAGSVKRLFADPARVLSGEIAVFSGAGRIALSVAEYCLTAILVELRRLNDYADVFRAGQWADAVTPAGRELTGRRVAILGASRTGRGEVAEGKPLWLDANQSYRPSAAHQLVDRVRDTPGLWCIEQPVGSLDWGGMRSLRARLGLPVAIDEGCFSATDLARSAALELADLVVIKTCKSAGLRGALRSAAVADAHGIEILASGLTDCGVGFAAALHLFSGLTLALPAELNGPELLADLYVDGLEIVDGRAKVPDGPGLGITVDEERIRTEARQ